MDNLAKQTASNTENQQELYILLKQALHKEPITSSVHQPTDSNTKEALRSLPTAISRLPSSPLIQANHPSKQDDARSSRGAASHGS
jgi:hypothetical protein